MIVVDETVDIRDGTVRYSASSRHRRAEPEDLTCGWQHG